MNYPDLQPLVDASAFWVRTQAIYSFAWTAFAICLHGMAVYFAVRAWFFVLKILLSGKKGSSS